MQTQQRTIFSFNTATPREGREAHALLSSLDANQRERDELLASGVARTRVEALYPIRFFDLFPGIHAYFDRHGVQHLRANVSSEQSDITKPAWWLDREGQQAWMAEHPFVAEDRTLLTVLEERISGDLGGTIASYLIRDEAIKLIWVAWWTMRNERLLRSGRGPAAYGLACWVRDNIFPDLEADLA